MRILFLLAHAGLFRNFESTLRGLAEQRHDVHVAFDSERYPSDAFAALLAAHPDVTTGPTPQPPADRWQALGRGVRATSDYLRYLDDRYAGAPKLRARARRAVPGVGPLGGRGRPWTARGWTGGCGGWSAALPLRPATRAFLEERAPDLLVVSPLFGSEAQLEALRAARALGIPSCHAVASWDNLTNKGLDPRRCPDTLLVWNEGQAREAVELHGVPAERVVVTGAQNFDEWFARAPSSTPQAFARRARPARGPARTCSTSARRPSSRRRRPTSPSSGSRAVRGSAAAARRRRAVPPAPAERPPVGAAGPAGRPAGGDPPPAGRRAAADGPRGLVARGLLRLDAPRRRGDRREHHAR